MKSKKTAFDFPVASSEVSKKLIVIQPTVYNKI